MNQITEDLTGLVNSTRYDYMEHNGSSQNNNSSYTPGEELIAQTFNLIIGGYTILIVSSMGIVLNTVGIRLLSTRSGCQNTFNMLLSTNLVFGTFFLAFQILRSVQNYFLSIPANYLRLYYIFMNSGARYSLTSSILMTVALGHWRYHAVSKPFRQRILMLSWKKRRIQFLKYLISTLILAMIFTIPIAWEIDSGPTGIEEKSLSVMPSQLRLNPVYSIFCLGLLNLGVLGLLPFGSLTYFTYKILESTKKGNCRRINRTRNQDDKLSKTLVAMIIVFLILHSLRIIAYIGEFFTLLKPNKDNSILQLGYGFPKWLHIVAGFSDLCTVLSASVNVLIYTYFNSNSMLLYRWYLIPNCFNPSYPRETTLSRRNSQRSISLQSMVIVHNVANNTVNVEILSNYSKLIYTNVQ